MLTYDEKVNRRTATENNKKLKKTMMVTVKKMMTKVTDEPETTSNIAERKKNEIKEQSKFPLFPEVTNLNIFV